MNPWAPMFLIGLGIGTGLLMLGLGIGLWLGRRMAPPPLLDDSLEREQFLRFVRNFATWTSDFAGDFSKYQSQLRTLSQRAESIPEKSSIKEVQTLLDQISQANRDLQARLENAEERLENQTKELASYLTEARTDGLTGLANRRAFDQKLDERFARWATLKKPFCLALLDIDFFKKINDTHGHPAGDAILQQVANQLRQYSADGIEVARYGGEEFALLLDLSLDASAKLVDRLRTSIQATDLNADGKMIRVTLSVGVSIILPEERIGKLVRRADEALYSAKLGGRNRVYVHDGTLCRPYGNPSSPIGLPTNATSNQSSVEPTAEPRGASSSSLQQRLQERLQRLVEEA